MTSMVMDTTTPPFREVGFCKPTVDIERRSNGTLIMRSGEPLPPFKACTTDWLEHWATVRPTSPMLAQRDKHGEWQSWSVSEVWDAVRAIATALLWHGAGGAAPVVILSENSIAQAMLTWGALHAGVPIAPVSPAYSLMGGNYDRLCNAVSLIKPHLVFVEDAERFVGAIAALGVPSGQVIAVDRAAPGMLRFDTLVHTPVDPDIAAHHAALDPRQPAKYMFTSGSTGMPKVVVQSRRNLAAAQEMTARVFERDPAPDVVPVYLEWLPWHHVMGGNIVLNRILRFGATLYIDDGRPMPGRFDLTLKNLTEVAPTLYFNVPAGLSMLVDALERDPGFAAHFFSRLTYVYYGGAVLSRNIYDRFQAVAIRTTGQRIVLTSVFGATESSGPAVTQFWAVDDVGCIGLPVRDVVLKLIEDPNLPGRYEMRIKGPNMIGEYLNAPEQTAAAFDEEGFYSTGDAVRFVDPDHPVAGLRFAGRFAEDFKLANGTWVRSAALRTRLLDACSPLLREAVIAHDGDATIGALAWADAAGCAQAIPALAGLAASELVTHPLLLAELAERLTNVNEGQTGASMRIARLMALAEPPSMQHYELTDKGSINQHAVVKRREDAVRALFAEPRGAYVVG